MKTLTSLLVICIFGSIAACSGQVEKEASNIPNAQNTVRTDTTKQMNLLDEQAKLLGSIFGTDATDGENPFSGITNYLELIEKMEGSPEEKQYLRDQYKLYDLGLDPKKKEEFKILFNKKLKEAMEKGMVEQQ